MPVGGPAMVSRLQALLVLTDATLAVWIAADVSFDGLGAGVALFGLSGRLVACPAALMLLGTAILMAWQSQGRWRAGWQYAALGLGMLFTTTIGWATMDAATASPWLHRSVNLLISASMMTLMTGVGLGRVLPRRSDWIPRGRRGDARVRHAGLAAGGHPRRATTVVAWHAVRIARCFPAYADSLEPFDLERKILSRRRPPGLEVNCRQGNGR